MACWSNLIPCAAYYVSLSCHVSQIDPSRLQKKSVILEKWFKQSFLALCFHFLLTRKKSIYDEAFDVFSVCLMHRQAIEKHGLVSWTTFLNLFGVL